MPELVEVEKVVQQLRPAFVGRSIVYVESLYTDKHGRPILEHFLRKHTLARWNSMVLHQPITDISRVGKNIIFKFGHIRCLMQVHLNSTGWFFQGNQLAADATHNNPSYKAFISTAISVNPYKHAMLAIMLDDGQLWYYVDPRTFGRFYLWKQTDVHDNKECDLLLYGPCWLNKPADAYDKLITWRPESPRKVKEVLLDQRITSGIGNYMVCEFLFRCGIDPDTPWNTVTLPQKMDLAKTAADFMPYALAQTDHRHWFVFGKRDEPCPYCKNPIRYKKDGPASIRGSYYCAVCQSPASEDERRVYTNIPGRTDWIAPVPFIAEIVSSDQRVPPAG